MTAEAAAAPAADQPKTEPKTMHPRRALLGVGGAGLGTVGLVHVVGPGMALLVVVIVAAIGVLFLAYRYLPRMRRRALARRQTRRSLAGAGYGRSPRRRSGSRWSGGGGLGGSPSPGRRFRLFRSRRASSGGSGARSGSPRRQPGFRSNRAGRRGVSAGRSGGSGSKPGTSRRQPFGRFCRSRGVSLTKGGSGSRPGSRSGGRSRLGRLVGHGRSGTPRPGARNSRGTRSSNRRQPGHGLGRLLPGASARRAQSARNSRGIRSGGGAGRRRSGSLTPARLPSRWRPIARRRAVRRQRRLDQERARVYTPPTPARRPVRAAFGRWWRGEPVIPRRPKKQPGGDQPAPANQPQRPAAAKPKPLPEATPPARPGLKLAAVNGRRLDRKGNGMFTFEPVLGAIDSDVARFTPQTRQQVIGWFEGLPEVHREFGNSLRQAADNMHDLHINKRVIESLRQHAATESRVAEHAERTLATHRKTHQPWVNDAHGKSMFPSLLESFDRIRTFHPQSKPEVESFFGGLPDVHASLGKALATASQNCAATHISKPVVESIEEHGGVEAGVGDHAMQTYQLHLALHAPWTNDE